MVIPRTLDQIASARALANSQIDVPQKAELVSILQRGILMYHDDISFFVRGYTKEQLSSLKTVVVGSVKTYVEGVEDAKKE